MSRPPLVYSPVEIYRWAYENGIVSIPPEDIVLHIVRDSVSYPTDTGLETRYEISYLLSIKGVGRLVDLEVAATVLIPRAGPPRVVVFRVTGYRIV